MRALYPRGVIVDHEGCISSAGQSRLAWNTTNNLTGRLQGNKHCGEAGQISSAGQSRLAWNTTNNLTGRLQGNTAAKKCIPRGRRSNHIPCWDAECEDLYQYFLQSPGGPDSDRAATALLTRLDGKRRNRWSETVRSIDFSHSSRLAWNTTRVSQKVMSPVNFNRFNLHIFSRNFKGV